MNPSDQKWQRLAAAARRASDAGEVAAPYGFATRVAARALASAPAGSLLERFSLRALGLAALLAVACVAANYSTVVNLFRGDAALADDPVAEVVDLAS